MFNCFLKLIIFICPFPINVTCAFIGLKTMGKLLAINTFQGNKNGVIFHLIDQIKFSKVSL